MTHLPLRGVFLAYFTPGANAGKIINLIAWCVSAACIAGLLIVGMQMTLQLRRGDPGENGEFFRGVFFVGLAFLIGSSAGPLVAALGNFSLQGDW